MVSDFVDNTKYKKNVYLAFEKNLLGTCGTLIKNIDFFESQDGLFLHADNYCEENLNFLLKKHLKRPTECLMTMLTFETNKPSQSGIVELDHKNIVTNFYEKIQKPPSNLANGAIYFISTSMIDILKKQYSGCTDFSKEIIPQFLKKIYTYKTNQYFKDVGDLTSYQEVNNYLLDKSIGSDE